MSNTDPTKHRGVNPGDRRRISSSWKLSLQDICQRFEQRIITLRYQMGNRKSKKGKQKDKPKSTKHYTENEKPSNTNPAIKASVKLLLVNLFSNHQIVVFLISLCCFCNFFIECVCVEC